MSTLTLNLIVKNESEYIEDCLKSVKNIVDEIIVVDTGSDDKTIPIAKNLGAKVFNFEWCDNFSAARNFALQQSTGDWILYLDADERLNAESESEIRSLISQKEKLGVKCTVKSVDNNRGTPNLMKYTRLFRNGEGIKFTGRIHEQIEPSLVNSKYQLRDSNIEIIHLGYDIPGDQLKEKAARNLVLLKKDYLEFPTSYNAFQIGQTYLTLDLMDNSIPFFKIALEDENLEKNHRAHAYRFLAANELHIGNYEKAYEYAANGLKLVNTQPLLHVVMSNIYMNTGKFQEAVNSFSQALRYNSLQDNEKNHSEFEIYVEENQLLIHGVNLAVISKDKDFFNQLYNKLSGSDIDNKMHNELKIWKSLLNNEELSTNELKNLKTIIPFMNFEVLLSVLNSYSNNKSKELILDELFLLYSGENRFLLQYGAYLIKQNNLGKAAIIFETVLSKDPVNKIAFLNLFNIYALTGEFQNLKEMIPNAEETFSDDTELLSKIVSIKNKLVAYSV